ncbi:MAG: D-lyxose/D-mannose family sugar isomerase [Fimbriimonadaceae bacterium]|nr:D-lyxose/D-mannose family sugar isomerase [Fimbriimonadaceae bacterium]
MWDITDFGLNDWQRFGLVLITLANEPEYCEKLMYARRGMVTPAHTHAKKKEDIIARWGELAVTVWPDQPNRLGTEFQISVNGEARTVMPGETIVLRPGERITIPAGIYHEFEPMTPQCIIGEVSTANDDLNDNFFVRDDIGRFPSILEDEEPAVRLVSDP